MLRDLARALGLFAAIFLVIYVFASSFTRHAGEPVTQDGPTADQVKAQCDVWLADAQLGRERRITRDICQQAEARARERR